ncbi:MAG: metalloregulator ArsR/SmtB family transcription factor [Rhodobacter sp.]|nr:metalloregulator ArsR/SmtB family transcription factor [Rhodobacter sp.]
MSEIHDPGLVATFAALGDRTRFAIVERLLTEGALSAGELQDVADISAPAISRHLKVLREAGLITQTVDRQRRIYAVAPQAVATIGAWTMSHRAFWQESLDRLAAALDEEEP